MPIKPNKRGRDRESTWEKFRIIIVKIIQNLEIKMESQINGLETRIEKMQEMFNKDLEEIGASLVAQRLKHLPAMWETWVQSLGREDPLEKEMATHSSILAWRIPWTEELGGLHTVHESQRVGHD